MSGESHELFHAIASHSGAKVRWAMVQVRGGRYASMRESRNSRGISVESAAVAANEPSRVGDLSYTNTCKVEERRKSFAKSRYNIVERRRCVSGVGRLEVYAEIFRGFPHARVSRPVKKEMTERARARVPAAEIHKLRPLSIRFRGWTSSRHSIITI